MTTQHISTTADKEKKRAASSSVLAAILLTTIKLVVGILTGSLGILSEAAHSGLDLVAALVTYLAVRFSGQPADEEHPYGHGKIENLSALVETLLLLITCVWIFYEAIERLFFKSVHVEATIWSFVVMGTSVFVDINRSRMLYRVAKKHKSQALEADALHFSTDIWSSLTVIGGLALVWASSLLGPKWEWLIKADAVAALVVAVIVVYVSYKLGKEAVAVLLDTAPPGLAKDIREEITRVSGVESIENLRVRQSGAATFVDLAVNVPRSLSVEEAHQIASEVEGRVAGLAPRSDVIVHVNPVKEGDESIVKAARAIASLMGLQIHHVHAHETNEEYHVNLDVEVDSNLSLGEAHQLVSDFEDQLNKEVPQVIEINSHIEPIFEAPKTSEEQGTPAIAEVHSRIMELVEEIPAMHSCHKFRIWPEEHGYKVTFHCRTDPKTTVGEAHRLAEELEKEIYQQIPGVSKAVIHMEPEWEQAEDNNGDEE